MDLYEWIVKNREEIDLVAKDCGATITCDDNRIHFVMNNAYLYEKAVRDGVIM